MPVSIFLAALFAAAAVATAAKMVVVCVSAVRTRSIPSMDALVPWGTAGLGLLAGAMASIITRGLCLGTVSMPDDLAGYLAVIFVGGWGFGVIHAAAESKWKLRPAWTIAPIAATTVLGILLGFVSEAW
jgi:hypothetical protein